jgi:hypothetical protein
MASTTMKPGNQGGTITFRCVNTTPLPGETRCFVPNVATGHSRDQCLLVEMSRGTGPGVTFIRSSARRNMDFVTASTFERLAEISVEGLAPLPGSGGYRDVYIYVATQNMPSKASGPSRREIPRAVGSPAPPRAAAADATAARAVADDQPRYRMNTYERIASVMPTYEVHVYHDTGQTRSDGSHTVKVLEPQPPFGYFVQHSGDLSGWRHDLMGQGVTLEEISPNFFHVKVPDNGSIQVRTRIAACESCLLGLGTRCGGVGRGGCATCAAAGGIGGGTAGPVVLMLVVVLVLLSRRHRHR